MTIDAAAQSGWGEFEVLNNVSLLQNPRVKLGVWSRACQPHPAARAASRAAARAGAEGDCDKAGKTWNSMVSFFHKNCQMIVNFVAKHDCIWNRKVHECKWHCQLRKNHFFFWKSVIRVLFHMWRNFYEMFQQKVKNSVVYWHDRAILHECSAFHLKWLA